MDMVEGLLAAGIGARLRRVEVDDQCDAYLELDVDGEQFIFAVVQKGRAPYPNEVPHLQERREQIARVARPLLSAPFITPRVGDHLAAAGWSWADEQRNYLLVAPGLRLHQRVSSKPNRSRGRQLPSGSGSGAIIRNLIYGWHDQPLATISALAEAAGVSQPRASQVMAKLTELGFVEKSGSGERRVVDREALLDRFLAEYRGPGGSERLLYSLDPPLVTAQRGAKAVDEYGQIVASADVGPDLVVPWRKPTALVLYSRGNIPDSVLGAVHAESRDSANVIVRIPHDTSVFSVRQRFASYQDIKIPLADPVQMVWDLLDLGGAEREEAAGMLREWIVSQT